MAGIRFPLGRTVITQGALATLAAKDVLTAVRRHSSGDWGDVCEEDREANDRALLEGTRLLSAYHSESGVRFWLITEADRSATTCLLPEEY